MTTIVTVGLIAYFTTLWAFSRREEQLQIDLSKLKQELEELREQNQWLSRSVEELHDRDRSFENDICDLCSKLYRIAPDIWVHDFEQGIAEYEADLAEARGDNKGPRSCLGDKS